MTAEIITIGDEILIGQITNTNSACIACELNLIGISVGRMTTVGDTKEEIITSIKEAAVRAEIILITGGLGPTSDDITKPALCEYFDTKLVFSHEVYSFVEAFLQKRGGTMNELNKSQAMVPESARLLLNPVGTAAGLWFEKDHKIFIAMPGVPFEMEKMMIDQVLPSINEKFDLPYIYHKTILTAGVAESKLAIDIADWEKQLPKSIKLAYLPTLGMVKLRLSGYGNEAVKDLVEEDVMKLQSLLGDIIYGYDQETLEIALGNILMQQNKTLATAESCTGGNIARLITSISGSSSYFNGGIVAYSNDIKHNLLKVPMELITNNGAVSKQVVESMAINILDIMNVDYSISISGIAGPTGGSVEKPVGTIWVAIASRKSVLSQKLQLGDNRERNIIRSSNMALNMLRLALLQNKI
jgi:nicotinamide-nucleotide amidase